MGVLIIFALMIVAAIVIHLIDDWWSDGWFVVKIGLIVFGTFGILISALVIACVQIPKQLDYENAAYEREVLEYRIENEGNNVIGNELLYADIVSFNNNLRVTKKWSGNFWIGLFINDKIAELDYIELPA